VSIDRERQEISINFVCFSVRESRSSTVRSARSSSSTINGERDGFLSGLRGEMDV